MYTQRPSCSSASSYCINHEAPLFSLQQFPFSPTRRSDNMTHASVLPRDLSFHLLEEITDGFSDERQLGSGAYGKVYKGVEKDGTRIAVKRLYENLGRDDEQLFRREFGNLARLRHQNIVRLVGYCYETKQKYMEHEGKGIFADETYRALCFEYMPKGSLDKYLDDESQGHGWRTRYAIIKGICEGLKYLHLELESPFYHLDLKPANVLLDENMMPKIADFGLSRFFGEEKTRTTASTVGTLGYLPPEFIDHHIISNKLDIFSLGVVMIKIMTGSMGYSKRYDMSRDEFIEHAHGNWMNRLRAESECASSYSEQVKSCIEIALSCVETERNNRPIIRDIVSKLNGTEAMIQRSPQSPNALQNEPGSSTDQISPSMPTGNELLDVHSYELRFPFEPNKLISCGLHLTNNKDDRVAFRCVPKNQEWYVNDLRLVRGYLNPKSSCTYVVTMRKQKHLPASMDALAVILESCVMHKDANNVDSAFSMAQGEESGGKVHKATLVAVCGPADDMTSEPPQSGMRVISYRDGLGQVRSIDVHPTEPWILTGHDQAYVSIWNYKTQERIIASRLTKERGEEDLARLPRICSAKFIARQGWFVVGDGYGYIRVRTVQMPMDELKEFKAHVKGVNSLAVHPNQPLVLSASSGHLIKLWNWETDWKCMMTFKAHSASVDQVVFNPQNDITFASASSDSTVKIWSIFSPNPIATFPCNPSKYACVDYFFPGDDRQYIVTGSPDGGARIWDLRTERCIKTLKNWCYVGVADCLQDRPVLVTASEGNFICLRNSNTYGMEKHIRFHLGSIRGFAYIKCIRSLAIGFADGIGIMRID